MWLIITLVSLVTFFLLILCIPLDLSLRLDVNDRARFDLKLVWLFGLVAKKIRKKERTARHKKAKPKKVKDKKGSAKKALRILHTKGLFKQTKVLVTEIFKSLSIKQIRADFTIGLDNPADTGLFFAYIGPAFVLLNHPERHSISIKPSFEDEAILEGYVRAVVRVLPVRLVIPLLKFIFSPTTFRIIRAILIAKWKRKK